MLGYVSGALFTMCCRLVWGWVRLEFLVLGLIVAGYFGVKSLAC